MWTNQQQKAIHKTDSDLLLTASAGSGKTAVLSERFLELIVNDQDPCDISRILVVTFTRAAVAEMRSRIGSRLLRHVEDYPNDHHARRQLSMLNCAKICTIDSFSSALLKEYFYLADIDPSFEIIDPKEKSLVLSRIMDEMLEDFYSGNIETNQSQFHDFARTYGGRSGDSQIPSIIRSLGNFIDSLVDSDHWLNFCEPDSDILDKNLSYFQLTQNRILKKHIEDLVSQLQYGESLLGIFTTVEHYREYITPTLEILLDAIGKLDSASGDAVLDVLANSNSLPISKRLSNKSKGIDISEKESITFIIKRVKETLKKIPDELLINQQSLTRQIQAIGPHVAIIIQLYKEFNSRYQQFKAANKVLDYADLSHKVLAVLNDNGKPSIAAIEQQKYYKYILVDEYQDISPLQEALFAAIKKPGAANGNMFMVGDLKQSIYRFRQAEPEIILEKHNQYAPTFDGDIELENTTGTPSRIELSKNFRSRNEIVNFVNYMFDQCLSKDFGGFDYISNGRMICGASYYSDHADNYTGKYETPIEFHLIDNNCQLNPDAVELRDSVRREAAMVANRIRQIVGESPDEAEFNIFCTDNKTMRPVTYRDIAILLRSPKSQAQVYSEVFDLFGVPLFVQQEGGFFDTVEISDIMSILQLVDNPRQDIPLAAALRSPFVALSENDLAEIRILYPEGCFHSSVISYANSGTNDSLRNQLSKFLAQINAWRNIARSDTLAALIRNIYSHTSMLTYYRGMHDGRQRYANLLHLYDTARDYDSFSTQGLGRFLRFIDDLSSQPSEDFGPARILSESDDVVQLMSIHKSKGLEFPVVIAAGLGKKFNMRDLSKPIFFAQADHGAIALRLRDPDTGESWKTLPYTILTEEERIKCLYEELRVQYVSLTRAREHLILFADTEIDKFSNYCTDMIAEKSAAAIAGEDHPNSTSALPAAVLASANSPLDWYGAVFSNHPDFLPVSGVVSEIEGNFPRLAVQIYDSDIINSIGADLSASNITDTEIDFLSVLEIEHNSEDAYMVCDLVNWQYPNHPITSCLARASVTAMNASAENEIVYDTKIDNERIDDDDLEYFSESDFDRTPIFMAHTAGKLSAADVGVLTHQFIELLDLTGDVDVTGLSKQMDRMISSGYFTARQAKNIDLKSIDRLFQSDTGMLIIQNHKTTYREWEFTLNIPVGEVYPDILQKVAGENDFVIVRGIVDCLVWNGASYNIIDFKTDNVKGDELISRAAHYKFQLEFYSRAVSEITGQSVSDCFLYFLKQSKAVNITEI